MTALSAGTGGAARSAPNLGAPNLGDRFRAAVERYRSGRPAEAYALAQPLARLYPQAADVRRLLAMSLLAQGREQEAAGELKALLALAPNDTLAALTLSRLLVRLGRPGEAAPVLAEAAAAHAATAEVMTAHAEALQADGRGAQALDLHRRVVDAAPDDAQARHNQASALGDLGHFPEAESAARAALGRGLDAPETWLVLARALQGQDRHDDAETAYREALRRRPAFAAAHRELADLVWMRTGDRGVAMAALDAAITAHPDDAALAVGKAQVLEHTGDAGAAYALLDRTAAARSDPWLEIAAAQAALSVDPGRALEHAVRARALGLDDPAAVLTLCEAQLACGMPAPAATLAERLLRARPGDQRALALLATAWRLTGDGRYHALHDYDALVRSYELEPPEGWPDLATYMRDLASSLRALHRLSAHPIGQSVRGGAQTQQNLLRSDDPAIGAFFRAVDAPIRRHIGAMQARAALFEVPTGPGYRLAGAWSVLLRPGGRHRDHMHPRGWISSACHVETPAAVEGEGRQGWLEFGRPDIPTSPALDAEHWLKPQAGRLVLFPSYMCHATTPFGGTEPRLSIAFDIVPET